MSKNPVLLASCVVVSFLLLSSAAMAADLYVDDDDVTCSGNTPCYDHIQDAVNVANVGDTVHVYPGTYDSRQFTVTPPHWSGNDQYAPSLIVWKDGLSIIAEDPNPANTIIQSTHDLWSNPVAIQASTGGVLSGGAYSGFGVNSRASPNGVIVVANDVLIEGFTVISTYGGDPGSPSSNPNTAAVLVGGMFAGDSTRSGISGTVIKDCVLRGHSGLRLWKAPDTSVVDSVIDNNVALVDSSTPKGAGVMIWDGWCDNPNYPSGGGWCEGPNVGSTGFHVLGNQITSYFGVQGIAIGGYYDGPMDHSDLYIDGNTISSSGTGVQFWNSQGTNKTMTCDNTVSVPEGYSQVAVLESSTYDGPFGIDNDEDGVSACEDCNDNNPDVTICYKTPSLSPIMVLVLVLSVSFIGVRKLDD